ncbi:MAG TPA: hypothetical protein VEP69_03575 [Thermodesulfovibrionales bacterium]|nr:hypothetical protein [Thermodesulfovibrionales bacterium]
MTQIRYIAGDRAGTGSYWNFSTGERITMTAEGKLPGSEDTVYYKANPFVILAVAPLLGLVFAAFLPFIGIAILLRVAAAKMLGGTAEGLARVATFNWSPSAAYLAGRKHRKEAKESKAPADEGSSGPGKE